MVTHTNYVIYKMATKRTADSVLHFLYRREIELDCCAAERISCRITHEVILQVSMPDLNIMQLVDIVMLARLPEVSTPVPCRKWVGLLITTN